MRFTQKFFIPLSSCLPFPSTRGSNLFCFSEAEINTARLRLLALDMRAWIETVAYTLSNWIPWSSAIYCWHPFWSAGESPFGHSRLGGGAQQVQPWVFPVFLTLALPSYFSLALFSLISNCSVDAPRGYPDGFLCSFSLIELEDLDLGESGIRADFPPSPGITRTLRRARRRGVASSYPRRIHILCLDQPESQRPFRIMERAAGVGASSLIACCTIHPSLISSKGNSDSERTRNALIRISRFVSKPLIFQFYFASVRIECSNIYPAHLHLPSRSDDVNLPLFLSFSLSIEVVQA